MGVSSDDESVLSLDAGNKVVDISSDVILVAPTGPSFASGVVFSEAPGFPVLADLADSVLFTFVNSSVSVVKVPADP